MFALPSKTARNIILTAHLAFVNSYFEIFLFFRFNQILTKLWNGANMGKQHAVLERKIGI